MWFQLHPADMSFVESSPFQLRNRAVIAAPPERVFEIIATGEGQDEWFQDFVACRWTSPPPHGEGATREIELQRMKVKERFLVWEPGKRLSFCLYASTLPLVTEMLEDMQLEPVGEKDTLLRWDVHYRPSLGMRLVHPAVRLVFGQMFRASIDGLARYAAAR